MKQRIITGDLVYVTSEVDRFIDMGYNIVDSWVFYRWDMTIDYTVYYYPKISN